MNSFWSRSSNRTKPPLLNAPFYWLIRLYKFSISPLLGNNCRFVPTCSEYAMECFTVHSLPVAFAKSTWRLLRCNPFGKGGHDPVVRKVESTGQEGNYLNG